MGRSREGVGHQFLNPWKGVGHSIFSYPSGVGHPVFLWGLAPLTTKVTPFKKLKQVTHLNTNQALAAMDSCFCLIKPHRRGIADR